MTNAAAIGYMILAAKSLAIDEKTIRALEQVMKEYMDFKTEERAEEEYNGF